MEEEKNWLILDIKTSKTIYGIGNKALQFSKKEIALEVAEQFFEDMKDCLIVNISDLHLQLINEKLKKIGEGENLIWRKPNIEQPIN